MLIISLQYCVKKNENKKQFKNERGPEILVSQVGMESSASLNTGAKFPQLKWEPARSRNRAAYLSTKCGRDILTALHRYWS